MKSFGMKESADYRVYVRGSKCAGCPKWGACAVKCKIDKSDFEAAKAGMAEARRGREGRKGGGMKECECVNWCRDGLHVREEMLANHHFRCPKHEAEFRRRALELIERLHRAMREWGAEEDGIPDFAWEAFCEADAVAGPTKAAKAGKEAK